jgi:hypothetical protein
MSTDATEKMPEIPAAAAESSAPATTGTGHRKPDPSPPSLHWGIVFLLSILTVGLFGWAWAIVEAGWVKKVQPASKALLYWCLAFVLSITAEILRNFGDENLQTLAAIPYIGYLVLWVVAAFSMKHSIEKHYNVADPLGRKLSAVMTFFFSVYYFQYHFTRINKMKRSQGQIV